MQIDDIKKKKDIQYQSDYLANHYGFDLLKVEEKIFKNDILIEDEKLNVLKKFRASQGGKKITSPNMFFYKKPVEKKDATKTSMGIDVVNIDCARAEATVIKTAMSILSNEGYSNFTIKLNAIGDKDSQKTFKEALTKYYNENKHNLKAVELKKITSDPIDIYHTQNKDYLIDINKNAPTPMSFLSNKSIKHFQDVIKLLEHFKINYIIDESLTGSKLFFSKILFQITASAPGSKKIIEVGRGGRYDEISEKTLGRKKTYAIGLTLNFIKKNNKKIKVVKKKINIHLLRIGPTAELKYLDILDVLSKTNTPVFHTIKNDKMSKQVSVALSANADYILVLGETEAKKNKVLVRKMKDFSQTEVDIKNLGRHIKKLIK